MASVSASDVNDINDGNDHISLSEDSASTDLANDDLALSSADADSIDDDLDLASSSNEAYEDSSANPSNGESSYGPQSNALSESGDSNSQTTINTSIESSTSNVVKGENYSVTLKDKDGNVLSGKKIIFTLNGTNFTRTTNSNGIASLTLNTRVGNYLIVVSFLGDDSYANSSFSQQLTVSKIPTAIENSTDLAVIGRAYSVVLKDKNGNPLSSKAVTLTFNGKTYKRTTNSQGIVSITLDGKRGNSYNLTYKFAGDSSYMASSGSVSLKLKMSTKIVGTDARIVQGKVFTVTLKDASNKLLANKKVTVLHNGKTYNRTSNSKGIVSLTLSQTPGKYYNISYRFAGDSTYTGSSKKLSVFIKTPTKFVNSGSFVCKGNVYYVTLKDSNDNVLANKTVKLTYGTKNYTLTTNSKGKVGVKINSAKGKVYKFTYKFNGNSLYGPSSGSLNLRTKLATSLIRSSATIIKGNPYKVTLKDSDGAVIANQNITFNFSGAKYVRTTNSKGIASLVINPSALKTYNLSYSYAGNSLYNKSSGNVSLAVKLGTTIKNSGTTVANNSSYEVTLKDSNNNALASKVIIFTLDGKTYRNTTNSKGVASLFISEKNFTTVNLTYKFAGDSMYVASSGSVKVRVVSDKVFTFNQIVAASKALRKYVEKNSVLPSTVTVNGLKVNITSFAYLMSKSIVNVNNGKKSSVEVVSVSSNYSNSGSGLINANLYKAGYLNLSNYLISYTKSNHKIPNHINTSIGDLSPNLYIFGLSKALDFYSNNSYLPNYLILNSEDVCSKSNASIKYGNASQNKKGLNEAQSLNATQLAVYLKSSGNDALNDAIRNLAKQLTSGKSTTLAKANAIFTYVRDNVAYEYYADTKYKATGTLSAKRGNCCDHANLVVALCRAANIPARYSHAQGCTFSSGLVTGHVWAQIYIDGVWYSADATSKRNNLGNIHNWNTNSFNTLKRYSHLPF